ncbi:hypothetical protein KSP39_PZI005436 [Platanthera zijinensis]|uniref:Uncharacterized protein n=1 Tax=Platanthera zijinensis TaxID=2320716 RepID=A0AAP0BT28_9ASPA
MVSQNSGPSGALPSAAQAAIDEKIRSMDYNECQTKIKTVDAQESLDGGVIVLVTGYLIGKDFVKKDFTQTFFLATQDNDNSYYVLNDIFRYVEDTDLQQQEQEFTHEVDALDYTEHDQEEHNLQQTAAPSEEDEIYNPSEHEEGSTVEDEDLVEVINEVPIKEVINEVSVDEVKNEVQVDEVINEVQVDEVINEVQVDKVINEVQVDKVINEVQVEEVINEVPVDEVINEVQVEEVINEVQVKEVINEVRTGSQALLADPGYSTGQEHKKSYASILKAMKEKSTPVSVPTSAPARMAPVNVERNVITSAPIVPPASEVTAAGSNDAESSNAHDSEVDGYSIYIKNLPMNATPAQLEEEFKKFGPIKPNGIQVRSNKLQGFCFGFVEFEVAGALQSAIEASPIMIGYRQAYVEEKRTSGSRVNNRGRFLSGRGGFRGGDGVRGRGPYGSGRGYGRGDYGYRTDFGNRGGGRSGGASYGQVDHGYQRVDHTSSNFERRSRPGSPGSQSNAAPRVPAST